MTDVVLAGIRRQDFDNFLLPLKTLLKDRASVDTLLWSDSDVYSQDHIPERNCQVLVTTCPKSYNEGVWRKKVQASCIIYVPHGYMDKNYTYNPPENVDFCCSYCKPMDWCYAYRGVNPSRIIQIANPEIVRSRQGVSESVRMVVAPTWDLAYNAGFATHPMVRRAIDNVGASDVFVNVHSKDQICDREFWYLYGISSVAGSVLDANPEVVYTTYSSVMYTAFASPNIKQVRVYKSPFWQNTPHSGFEAFFPLDPVCYFTRDISSKPAMVAGEIERVRAMLEVDRDSLDPLVDKILSMI